MKNHLAPRIQPDMNVYKQLHKDIFGGVDLPDLSVVECEIWATSFKDEELISIHPKYWEYKPGRNNAYSFKVRNIACCQSRRQNETPLFSGLLKTTSDDKLLMELARRGYDLKSIRKKKTTAVIVKIAI